MVEHRPFKAVVVGSSPTVLTNYFAIISSASIWPFPNPRFNSCAARWSARGSCRRPSFSRKAATRAFSKLLRAWPADGVVQAGAHRAAPAKRAGRSGVRRPCRRAAVFEIRGLLLRAPPRERHHADGSGRNRAQAALLRRVDGGTWARPMASWAAPRTRRPILSARCSTLSDRTRARSLFRACS